MAEMLWKFLDAEETTKKAGPEPVLASREADKAWAARGAILEPMGHQNRLLAAPLVETALRCYLAACQQVVCGDHQS